MRNSRYFLCAIIFILAGRIDLSGQEDRIHLEIGYGSYAMNQLSELGDYLASLNTLPLIENADYPPYLYYGLAYSKRWTGFSAGFSYAHESTGARQSLADITGKYVFDTRVISDALSAFTRFHLTGDFPIQFSLYAEAGALYSRLRIEEDLQVDDEMLLNEDFQFRAIGMFMEGGLVLGYSRSFWDLNLKAGYMVQPISQALQTEIDGEPALLSYRNNKVKPEWSGVRLGLEFCINLSELLKKEED